MSTLKYALKQGPVIAALGRTAFAAVKQRFDGVSDSIETPGPTFTDVIPPRDAGMVRDYLRWAGGDVSAWKGRVPAHLFPQWGFPLISKTLAGVPYPLAKVLNGGCRVQIHGDLPIDEPLHLSARLEGIDDDGRRAVLHQRLVTSLSSGTPVVTTDLYAIVPLRKKGQKKKKKTPILVPTTAREIGWHQLAKNAGLEFACLTGDFNPIHWVPVYARAAGFKNCILHGFGTLAIALETMNRTLWAGDTRRLAWVDVRFVKPLLLPQSVGIYIDGENELYVGAAPGSPAWLTGSYQEA